MQLESHVTKGVELLEAIPALKFLIPMVRNHHEHWDGSGYPDGLKGATIPLLARIAALADAFEAMTDSNRARVRPSLSLDEVFQEIQRNSGTQFDPACVCALLRVKAQIEELLRERGALLKTISRQEMQQTMESCRSVPANAAPNPMLAAYEMDETAG